MKIKQKSLWMLMFLLMGYGMMTVGCGGASTPAQTVETAVSGKHEAEEVVLVLPELSEVDLNGSPLKVVATTSIIGDVVAQVGGDAIDLTTLMSAGQDPHSYEPGARELTAVADADVIFVNGWDLEESFAHDLEEIGSGVAIVPISANIDPLIFGADAHVHDEEDGAHEEADDEHHHTGADPHVWFSVHNVEQWVDNVAQVLGTLDAANAQTYESNAAAYREELADLAAYAETQLAEIPENKHFLVTNHDSLGYFAHDYGFELIGTVIPSASTLAEPSANDLANLIQEMDAHNICTIFTETTVSDTLAQTIATELTNCDDVQVVKLYTGAIGAAGSGADSYSGMMRANVDAIAAGLR